MDKDQLREIIDIFFDAKGGDMTFNTDNVKAMDRRNDGVVILTCEDRKNLSVYLTPKQVETIANWYNAANSVTVEPETTVLRVNSIELADYGEILLKLEGETCGDGVVDTVVYVGPKHIKEIADYYNEKHSVTKPAAHQFLELDNNGLIEIHNNMIKGLLANPPAPGSLLEDVLAIRKQLDNENYWRERISRLD